MFGLLGLELTSMMFVMAKMAAFGSTANAAAMGCLRIVHVIAGLIIVNCAIGPERMRNWGNIEALLDKEHMNTSHLVPGRGCFVPAGRIFHRILTLEAVYVCRYKQGIPLLLGVAHCLLYHNHLFLRVLFMSGPLLSQRGFQS